MSENIFIEVNLKNLEKNLKKIKSLTGEKTKVAGIIKQNAYGHGLIPIARKLAAKNIDFLGVHNTDEAFCLLKSNVRKARILILSNTLLPDKNLKFLIKNNVRFTVMDNRLISDLNKTARSANTKVKIHIKIDTGMSRLGVLAKEAEKLVYATEKYKNVYVEGIYSHLSCAESNPAFTRRQIQHFKQVIANLKREKIKIPLTHICNSSAAVNYPQAHFDMARTGLLLYGIKPTPDLEIEVKPVLSLKAKIIFIKKILKNSYVSYGNTFKTEKDTLIGVISCGYAHGYAWNLSNSAEALINGKKRPVLGRICMDHMIVDLSGLESSVQTGDIVTLIGKDGTATISAETLAEKANTIPYEIVTRLLPTIKRVYIG